MTCCWMTQQGYAGRLWNMLSPTMRVAAASAMQHNPECMHWMVFLHLSMADAHEGTLFPALPLQSLFRTHSVTCSHSVESAYAL